MAITRIKTDQITDSAVTTGKIADDAITAAKLADSITYGSDLTVTGNLTVSGTTTAVATTNTRVDDALIVLAQGTSGSPSEDAGILIDRGSSNNMMLAWDESADKFIAADVGSEDGDTVGNVSITGYAALKVGAFDGAAGTFSGAVNIDDTTASSSVTSGSLIVDGGAGVAGALYVGGRLDVASGQVIDFNTCAITNVADPSGAQDAATKAYVDSADSTGSTLTIAADTGSNDTVTVGTDTLTFNGTSNEIATTVSNNAITIALPDDVTIGGVLTVTGNLVVNGTTTTLSSTNTVVEDTLLELNTGAGSNSNDMGLIMERGSTGNNAIILWDESEDKFAVGTTTAVASATGNISYTVAGLLTGAISATGSVTASTSFIIGSADLNETDMEKLDGITNGTVAANKAVVADGNLDISTLRNVTASGTVKINDNGTFAVGSGSDFTIAHDATNTQITNGTGILKIDGTASSSIRINEAGANVDVVIEGDSDTALFTLDASQDNIGIGGAPNANCIMHFNDTGAIIIPNGTTAQRPTGVTGQFRYNSTTNGLEFYDDAGWESLSTSYTVATSQTFTGDGSDLTFTLSALSGSDSYTTAGVLVMINGVVQQPTVVYGISGTTLTFTSGSAPADGDLIEVRKFTTATTIKTIADADGDTQVQCEESSDEDKVRIDAGGSQIAYFDSSGITLSTGSFVGTATEAKYADLAEKYASDEDIAAGTVVHFVGEGKVASCNAANCPVVAGVVSTDPAYLMNSAQEGISLALAGRVPTKVTGAVAAGDLMVSAGNGMARAEASPNIGTVIGKAIEANEGGEGVIEILVMMM